MELAGLNQEASRDGWELQKNSFLRLCQQQSEIPSGDKVRSVVTSSCDQSFTYFKKRHGLHFDFGPSPRIASLQIALRNIITVVVSYKNRFYPLSLIHGASKCAKTL